MSGRKATDEERAMITTNVETAFETIRTAATLLSLFPYDKFAASLRRQEDQMWFTNPTLAQQHDKEDLRRKLELLDAAAAFSATCKRIGEEVLGDADG